MFELNHLPSMITEDGEHLHITAFGLAVVPDQVDQENPAPIITSNQAE